MWKIGVYEVLIINIYSIILNKDSRYIKPQLLIITQLVIF